MDADGLFNERVAATYDERSADMATPEVLNPTVDVLVDLANGGRALEFAIGTGRVALPLSERGIDVAGIELSSAMVRQLRTKPGGETLDVVIGDMTTAQAGRDFSLVYLVYNTIHNLVTQDLQVACFQNASAHLRPGGHFLIEVLVPPLQRLPEGERFQPFDITDDHWGIDEFDVVTQEAVSHHVRDNDGRFERFSLPYRYVWPSELDLMARLAGMSLAHRWADWDRSPFTADSQKHVSVWRKDG